MNNNSNNNLSYLSSNTLNIAKIAALIFVLILLYVFAKKIFEFLGINILGKSDEEKEAKATADELEKRMKAGSLPDVRKHADTLHTFLKMYRNWDNTCSYGGETTEQFVQRLTALSDNEKKVLCEYWAARYGIISGYPTISDALDYFNSNSATFLFGCLVAEKTVNQAKLSYQLVCN